MESIFSIDVEDWFHLLDLESTPSISKWDFLPSHVEKNFCRLLDLMQKKNVICTCFFLGWIAEKFPQLVKEAANNGHEVASHGYSHQLVYEMTKENFYYDAKKSKDIIEDIIGSQVKGYRCAGFSVTEANVWFFDKLIEAGYLYDSSVFPAPRGHGGMKTNRDDPHLIFNNTKSIFEFPITVTKIFGYPLAFSGGGYLRLFPYTLIKKFAFRVLKSGRPVIFYIHPREIDSDHPRLLMSRRRHFRSYVNLKTTERKIQRIFKDFQFTTFEKFIDSKMGPREG